MALQLRRTGSNLSHRFAVPAYHVVERETVVGRIHQGNGLNKWIWTIYTAEASERAGGMASSLAQARSSFKRAWNGSSGNQQKAKRRVQATRRAKINTTGATRASL